MRLSCFRPRFLADVLVGLGLAAAFSSCDPGETSTPDLGASGGPPNVVLIVVDTLRADRLGCYGYERPTSPVIDALASEGAVFLEARAQASWTAQSMVSMLSGRYLTSARDIFEADATALAEQFHEAGYRTLGSVGNVILSSELDFDRGFDRYSAKYSNPEDAPEIGPCRTADQLVDELLPMVDAALEPREDGSRAPLFLYLHPMDPHSWYLPHAEFDAALPVEGATDDTYFAWQREVFAAEGSAGSRKDPGWKQAWADMEQTIGLYDQEVRFTDAQVGRLLEGLRERGVLEHAVVALASDHGETLWDNRAPQPAAALAKSSPKHFFHPEHQYFLFEPLLRTPLILWGSGVSAHTRVAQPVENVDLYPTLLELAGLPPAEDADGASLVPLLRGEGPAKPYVFARILQHISVLETATRLKLVLPTGAGRVIGKWEIASVPGLYDLEADPHERVNLYDERPAEVERLRRVLREWIEANPTEEATELDRHTDRRHDLQALGYLGGVSEDEDED